MNVKCNSNIHFGQTEGTKAGRILNANSSINTGGQSIIPVVTEMHPVHWNIKIVRKDLRDFKVV